MIVTVANHENDDYIVVKRYNWEGQGRPWSYKMRNFSHSTKIVTVDVPDPDNFLMILRVLKDNPHEKIDIVISPRPVDLRAVPYGDRIGRLIKQIQEKHKEYLATVEQQQGAQQEALSQKQILLHLLGRNTDADANWIGKLVLDKEDQAWFYTDAGFESEQVRNDTELYMQVSAYRLRTYLGEHGIPPEQYCLYTDKSAEDHIVCGIRHAMHKPDWSWNFGTGMKSRYQKVVKAAQAANQPLSDELRQISIQLMKEYVDTKAAALKTRPEDLFQSFEELFSRNKSTVPDVYVGGPYTEAWTYASQMPVKSIIGMGGFIRGDNNLFPNQFNFLVDMDSAEKVLAKASEGAFALTLVPTECVKCSDYDFASVTELEEQIGKVSPPTVNLYRQWADSDDKARCTPFDLLAAMIVKKPDLFKTRTVSWYKDGDIIRFAEDTKGLITMCWDDKEHMAKNKDLFLGALRDTFTPSARELKLHRANSNM